MANGFFWNPSNSNAGFGQGPLALTEAQWRAQIAVFELDVDTIERNLVAGIGVKWYRAPDGDYWVDVNSVAPPAFTPSSSTTGNANETTTSFEGDPTVSG